MDIITLAILAFSVVCVLVGFLLGLLRGCNRSLLRLCLVIVCAVGAFILKDVVTNAIMGVQLGGQTITQIIEGAFVQGDQVSSPALINFITVLAKLLMGLVAYFIIFFVLQALTWAIVFPIMKIFVKKGQNKRTFVGGAIGLVQGVLVAFVICAPLTGMFFQMNTLMGTFESISTPVEEVKVIEGDSYAVNTVNSYALVMDNDEEDVINAKNEAVAFEQSEPSDNPFAALFGDFVNVVKQFVEKSPVAKAYNSTGSWYFEIVATTTDHNGNRVSLSTTVQVLDTAVQVMANKDYGFTSLIEDVDKLSTCTEEEMPEILRAMGNKLKNIDKTIDKLDAIGAEMFDEFLSGIKDVIFQNSENMSDKTHQVLENLDSKNLKLGSLGDVFITLADFQDIEVDQHAEQEDYDHMVNVLAENTFVLDLFEGEFGSIRIHSKEEQDMIVIAINKNTTLSEAYKTTIRNMFGITQE